MCVAFIGDIMLLQHAITVVSFCLHQVSKHLWRTPVATHTQQLEVLIYSRGRVLDRPLQLSEQFHCGLQNLMDTISMYAKSHNRCVCVCVCVCVKE